MNVVEDVRSGLARLREATTPLTETQMRAPSALPDWTRGHVIAHVIGFGRGARRQIEYALRGELIEFYDGGRPGRSADIEANAHRPAAELIPELHLVLDGLINDWAQVGDQDWDRRVTYRDGVLADVLHCCWREVEIHLVDLAVGAGPTVWSQEFCRHAIDFLTPRAPSGVRLELATGDGDLIVLGSGRPVTVSGELSDLTAWLAGRHPDRELTCSDHGLPELGPWP